MESKQVKQWRGRIDACRKKRDTLKPTWQDNVAARVNKPVVSNSDTDRVAVPQDWSRTRAKQAQLFSAVPTVTLSAEHPRYAQAVPVFQKEFNHVLTHQAKPHVALEECLSDLINASGMCAAIVRYEATFEQKEVPAHDLSLMPPEQAAMLLATKQIPMATVEAPVCERFVMRRISPLQLIWDTTFKGSDWNDAPFVGNEGALPWAVAKREFKLTDEDKATVLGMAKMESLSEDEDDSDENLLVSFVQVFYRAAFFDPEELHLEKLRRIVFVEGITDRAVVDEDYQGQRYDEQTRKYVGSDLFPIQVATLNYVSDQLIPPSDSEVGRPMVQAQGRSRSQMQAQQESSLPARWMDVNRVDPMVADQLQRGVWQGFIPVQGDGSRAIGEVARAAYPPQNFQFDQVINKDLDDSWGLSQNQLGGYQTGERSASEANIVAGANATIIGRDRGKVVRFFLNLCEVLGGLMQLHFSPETAEDIVGPDGVQRLASWDMVRTAGKFVYSIRQDSTVLLDSNQRINQLMRTLNLVGKSGYVNVQPIIAEIIALSGLDPGAVMVKPQPPAPEQANVSLRLSGVEDLTNPIVVAMLMKEGKAPSKDEIQAAKLLLADAAMPLQPAPEVTSGPVPQHALPPAPDMADAPMPNPDWAAMPRITKRPEELGS